MRILQRILMVRLIYILVLTKPKEVKESNYIKSIEDRGVIVALRLYGSSVEFFDQTWIPDDVVKIK